LDTLLFVFCIKTDLSGNYYLNTMVLQTGCRLTLV